MKDNIYKFKNGFKALELARRPTKKQFTESGFLVGVEGINGIYAVQRLTLELYTGLLNHYKKQNFILNSRRNPQKHTDKIRYFKILEDETPLPNVSN